MSSNDPKRHHYIPQFLLKNFLDDSGRFWVFDKKKGKLHQGTPRNTFVEKNLYRTLNFDTTRDLPGAWHQRDAGWDSKDDHLVAVKKT